MTKFTLQYLKLLLHYNYKWAIVIEKLLPLQGGGSKATLLAKWYRARTTRSYAPFGESDEKRRHIKHI